MELFPNSKSNCLTAYYVLLGAILLIENLPNLYETNFRYITVKRAQTRCRLVDRKSSNC